VSKVPCLWLALVPGMLAAQTPASLRQAVSAITPADVIARIGILADDSMLGRATPSPQIEKVARYIAGEFRRFGLRPAGDSGGFIQHYPIVRRTIDTSRSTLTITGSSPTPVVLHVGVQVNLPPFSPPPTRPVSGSIVVVAGSPDATDPLGTADVSGAWLGQIVTAGPQGFVPNGEVIGAALRRGAIGVLFISNRPEDQWRDVLQSLAAPAYSLGGRSAVTTRRPAFVEIRDATAARLLGIDPVALRAQRARSARRLRGVTLTLQVRPTDAPAARAPNVIGILEGRDPRLKREYVFLTGHMDHIGTPGSGEGCTAQGADSICNGADDDASGSTAVLEAARAFARLSPRPRRSLVFMTVSGEERGLWGSEYFTEHPTVPLANAVADLNTDMVGRNWKDTIVAIGKEHSDLGATLNRVAAAHPELDMNPIDDLWPQENFYFRSDHYNFARKGVPILFFFNGVHADYHQVGDEVSKIDGEKESRIVKLVFYLALDLANAAARPKWNPDSYRRIVQGAR